MPLVWKNALSALILLLAGLYPDRDKARLVVRAAGLDPDEIDLAGIPKVFWMRIIEEANRRDRVAALIGAAKQDFRNINFDALERGIEEPKGAIELPMSDDEWHMRAADTDRFEKIIGSQPTFLPISFLEIGISRSKAIARIEGPKGLGTGFLIGGNLIITNNHVLATPEDARVAKVWFNYQKTPGGAECAVSEMRLDPNAGFATSPANGGDDWTAIRVSENAKELEGLQLSDVSVKLGDYVNIIQHPGGMHKQIALYHNVVTYVDETRVQYLTDTMPGSSGSPVFDSDWRVVSLHHRGGWLTEPANGGVFFRNQGVHVRTLLGGLRASGLLSREA